MSVTILIPTPLRPYTDQQESVVVSSVETVDAAISELIKIHEGLSQYLIDSDGNLRKFVNIYVNDTDIRDQKDGETPVQEGDTVSIIPAIAGGL
jgi:molybdopterin converting factor small subunit